MPLTLELSVTDTEPSHHRIRPGMASGGQL
jgi:hypothetical protein